MYISTRSTLFSDSFTHRQCTADKSDLPFAGTWFRPGTCKLRPQDDCPTLPTPLGLGPDGEGPPTPEREGTVARTPTRDKAGGVPPVHDTVVFLYRAVSFRTGEGTASGDFPEEMTRHLIFSLSPF